MPSETFYNRPRNWENIDRQYMFEAIVMFAPERPLGFFIPDPSEPDKGKIEQSMGEFTPGQVQQAVVGLKQRKVLILSPDVHNHSQDLYDVIVAPIYSLTEQDKSESWYTLLKEDNHPFWVFLSDSVTGKECFVDLTEMTTLHKNMLLSRKNRIPDERMEKVEAMMEKCLGLGLNRAERNRDNTVFGIYRVLLIWYLEPPSLNWVALATLLVNGLGSSFNCHAGVKVLLSSTFN